jgi:hypothetical protein
MRSARACLRTAGSGYKKSRLLRAASLLKMSKDSMSASRKRTKTEMETMRVATVQAVVMMPKAKVKKKNPRKARVKRPLLEETTMKMTNRSLRLVQAKLFRNSMSSTRTTT